jgi:hypothetical protein
VVLLWWPKFAFKSCKVLFAYPLKFPFPTTVYAYYCTPTALELDDVFPTCCVEALPSAAPCLLNSSGE